jgi:hypothetical protein
MTDEQLNLYIDLRRKYARTCADIENIRTERSTLDDVYTKGSMPPGKVGILERILVALRLRRRRLTRLDGKRLTEIGDRLNYLDEVLKRAESVRAAILSQLSDCKPTTEEMRIVDVLDAVERIRVRQDSLERIVKAMLK